VKPNVVGSNEMRTEERPPPSKEFRTAHRWLTIASRMVYEDASDSLDLFVSKLAEEKIRNHAIGGAEQKLEVMGFLLGNVYRHEGTTYSLVRDVATTDLDASSVRVRFQSDAMERLFESIDDCGFSYLVVGWYHSHPGHGCVLSSTDVDTQRAMFNKPYHSALVIDPVRKEIEAFRIENGIAVPRPFAVYWDKFQNPYYGETVVRRKLLCEPERQPKK
jgi:26S proteasome regulatory subunit N11